MHYLINKIGCKFRIIRVARGFSPDGERHSTDGGLVISSWWLFQRETGRLSNSPTVDAGKVSAVHTSDAYYLGKIVSKIWC